MQADPSQQSDISDSTCDDLQSKEDLEAQDLYPPATDDPVDLPATQQSVTIIILLTAFLMMGNVVQAFSVGGVSVMLDALASDLHITDNNLQWTINSLQLPLVSESETTMLASNADRPVTGLYNPCSGQACRFLGKKENVHVGMCNIRNTHARRWICEEANCILRMSCYLRYGMCVDLWQQYWCVSQNVFGFDKLLSDLYKFI
jgi:hypothetical protein